MDAFFGGKPMNQFLRVATVLLLCASCNRISQGETSVVLSLSGTDVVEPVIARGDVPVELDEANLAFGPLYLCAGPSAGDLCETARLEWLSTAVVDTLDSTPQEVGLLVGTTGPVLSYMYDLGISSQLTRGDPFVLEAAASIGDASLSVSGTATVEGIAIPFRAAVAVQQNGDTELGVPVVRKSTSEDFSFDVTEETSTLEVRFDPREWISGIDFGVYVANEVCRDGRMRWCATGLERSCEGELETSTRDCADAGQVCLPGAGCRDELVIEPDTTPQRSMRNALLSAGRPLFVWNAAPSP